MKLILDRAVKIAIKEELDPIEAFKKALLEERKLIDEMLGQNTDRSKEAFERIRLTTYLSAVFATEKEDK